jgi:hypothetical protein
MSSTILLPPRAQLCIRYCSKKNTHTLHTLIRETAAHFSATGLPSQQNRSDNAFRFKRAAFYMGLKSKVGLVAAKACVCVYYKPRR